VTTPVPGATGPPVTAERAATFREVFAVREFRPLFGTFLLSTIGDELARVALTVLVYERTESPLLSAITFAISYLPWLLGGPLLSTLADRLPRHRVLISSDAIRALVVAAMAIPGTPLPVLLGLLFLVALCAPPFESARSALMADVMEGDRYAVATSLTNISLQVAQVVGFLLAGALLAVLSPSGALLLNALTFAVSAVWLSGGLQRRPAPVDAVAAATRSVWQHTVEGMQLIARTPRLLAIIAVLWVTTLFGYAYEGIAAPFVAELGQGPTAVGVLLAANPLGVTVGGLILARLVRPDLRERLVPFLVVVALVPLVLAGLIATLLPAALSSFTVVVILMFVAGLGGAWLIPLNVAFVNSVPASFRGRAFGVAVTGLYGMQGLGVLAAGVVAEGLAPSGVVTLFGAVGLAAVVLPLLAYVRTQGHMAPRRPAAGPSVP
jgi:MFS family permease